MERHHQSAMLPAAELEIFVGELLQQFPRPDLHDLSFGRAPFGVFDEFIPAAVTETPLGVQIIRLPVGHETVGQVFINDFCLEDIAVDLLHIVRTSGVDFNGAHLAGVGLAVDHLELGKFRLAALAQLEAVCQIGALHVPVEIPGFHRLGNGTFCAEDG